MKRISTLSILFIALVAGFLLLIPSSANSNIFKKTKDKLILKYAGCYKKAKVERRACKSNFLSQAKGFDAESYRIEQEISDNIQRTRDPEVFEEMKKKTKDMKRLKLMADKFRGDYQACLVEAEKYLLNCRLDKKKFKPGCSEAKMEKALAAIDGKVQAAAKKHDKCKDKCFKKKKKGWDFFDKMVANYKGGKEKMPEKLVERLRKSLKNKIKDCESKCKPYGNPKIAEKMRMEAMKNCISIEK